jgi:hypothetical protein
MAFALFERARLLLDPSKTENNNDAADFASRRGPAS